MEPLSCLEAKTLEMEEKENPLVLGIRKMAASRVLSRLLSARLPSPSLKPKSHVNPLKSSSQSQIFSSVKPISRISRLPVELSCMISMMPLHSTIASARLRSLLPTESQCWGLVPQGLSLPL